jgi:hypothetical protein
MVEGKGVVSENCAGHAPRIRERRSLETLSLYLKTWRVARAASSRLHTRERSWCAGLVLRKAAGPKNQHRTKR